MTTKLKRSFIVFIALFIILSSVLASGAAEAVSNKSEESLESKISFVDDEGTQITLDKPAERVISLYSAHTENLYSLGAEDQMIGDYTTCIYPAAAAKLPKYTYSGDPEKIIAADPDVVFIRPFITRKAPEFIQQLKDVGITVVSLYPDTFGDFDSYIRRMALVMGKEDEAEKLLDQFHLNIAKITEQTKEIKNKKNIFFESTEVNIRTISKGAMPDLAISFAGGENIGKDLEPMTPGSSIATFGVEKVLENAENIDVYISQRGAMNAGGSIRSIKERPGYETIKAVKDGKVYVLNEKLISSPTFRFYKGVHEIARYLYPEIFDDVTEYNSDKIATKADFAHILVKMNHIPIFVPSSSKYYKNEIKGHAFGLFEDVSWKDYDFDDIETAVYAGLIDYEKTDDGLEFFYPENKVTRNDLASAIYLLGDFSYGDVKTEIKDIDSCKVPNIVQKLVDNDIIQLDNGYFNPNSEVTCQEIVEAIEKAQKK